jgi:hypothetical protein
MHVLYSTANVRPREFFYTYVIRCFIIIVIIHGVIDCKIKRYGGNINVNADLVLFSNVPAVPLKVHISVYFT